MKKLLSLLILCIAFEVSAFASGESFREKLITEKNLGYVTPFGDRLTYIKGVNAVYNVYPSLVRFALEKGGVPEVRIDGRWSEVKLVEEEGWLENGFHYIHPVTGKKEPFGYGDIITEWDPTDGSEYPPLVRMRGVFSLFSRGTALPVRQETNTTIREVVDWLILLHDTPQPFVYKKEYFPPLEELVSPPRNMEVVTRWLFVTPEEKKKSGAGKFFKGLGAVMGLKVPEQRDVYSSAEIYLGFTGVCLNQGGTPSYYLQGQKAGPIQIYNRTYNRNKRIGTTFQISCSGPQPFLVTDTVSMSGKGNITIKHGVTFDQQAIAEDLGGRIDNHRMTNASSENSPRSFESIAQTTKTENMGFVNQPASRPESIHDEVALRTAAIKGPVSRQAGSQFTGLYHGEYQGCSHVSTIQDWLAQDPQTSRSREGELVVWNYRICNGQITKKQPTTLFGRKTVPDRLDSFILQVARDAQKYGIAEATALGYDVRGFSLRDEEQCKVDVRVFKDMNLIHREIRNGCR